jgi:hypothetical protein
MTCIRLRAGCSLVGTGQRDLGHGRGAGGRIDAPQGNDGLGAGGRMDGGMFHAAEIQVLQGAGKRGRAQVADGAIPVVDFRAVVAGLFMVVLRKVSAIMQEGPRQCQEAHRKDEQTCEI